MQALLTAALVSAVLAGCASDHPAGDAKHDAGPGDGGPKDGPPAVDAPRWVVDGPAALTCPNDPQPCPGICNTKGYCEMDCGLGPEVRIPAGTVVMGSDPDEQAQFSGVETPEHLATITHGFYIDKLETQVGHYRQCVQAGSCTAPNVPTGCIYYETSDSAIWRDLGLPPGPDRYPADCISWEQARAYCAWKGARLPTEAEWMLAARGPAGTSCETVTDLAANDGRCNERLYPWGDQPDSRRANVRAPDGPDGGLLGIWPRWRAVWTTPGGFFDGTRHPDYGGSGPYQTRDGSSMYGVHDLIGNLFEWTSEAWGGADYFANAPRIDPQGPMDVSPSAARLKKSQAYDPPGEATSFRSVAARDYASSAGPLFGFRCVRDAD